MKKIILFLVITVLILNITGCVSQNDKINSVTYENTEALFPADAYPVYDKISKILNNSEAVNLNLPLVKESQSASEYDGYPFTGKAQIYLNESVGYAYSSLSAASNRNPIAGVNILVKNNVLSTPVFYDKDEYMFSFNTSSIATAVPRSIKESINDIPKAVYPYTQDGARKLVADLDLYNNLNYDNEEFRDYSVNSLSLRWADKEPEIIEVSYSDKDDCYYGYSVTYSPYYSMCAAIYLKSSDKINIDEAEIQIMDISYPTGNYAAGGGMFFSAYQDNVQFEFVSLYSCLEKILTGDFKARELIGKDISENGDYKTPLNYTVGDGKVSLTISTLSVLGEFYNDLKGIQYGGGDTFRIYTYKIKL